MAFRYRVTGADASLAYWIEQRRRPVLAEGDLLEAKRVQQSRESGASVALGSSKDAAVERGLAQVSLCFCANFRFEVGVGRHKQAGDARVDACLAVIQ